MRDVTQFSHQISACAEGRGTSRISDKRIWRIEQNRRLPRRIKLGDGPKKLDAMKSRGNYWPKKALS